MAAFDMERARHAAALDAVDLRRGRYAAAQLWKLTSVRGVYLDLGELIAPFLGDAYAVVPHELIVLTRRLGRLAIPREIPRNIRQERVRVWADEVAGHWDLPVHYTTIATYPRNRNGVLPERATTNGYFCAELRFTPLYAFGDAWEERFGDEWPYIRRQGRRMVHPTLHRMHMTSQIVEDYIIQHNERRLRAAHRQRMRRAPADFANSPLFHQLIQDFNESHP